MPVFSKYMGHAQAEVSAVGQGTGMGFANRGREREKHLVRVLHRRFECGITLLDTSDDYFAGYAEEVVGKAIRGKRESAFVSTKFAPENNKYDGVLRSTRQA